MNTAGVPRRRGYAPALSTVRMAGSVHPGDSKDLEGCALQLALVVRHRAQEAAPRPSGPARPRADPRQATDFVNAWRVAHRVPASPGTWPRVCLDSLLVPSFRQLHQQTLFAVGRVMAGAALPAREAHEAGSRCFQWLRRPAPEGGG